MQQRAIPLALSGRDLLITSATASGKTEAYAAPAVERALAAPPAEGCRVLIVVPTRALANDLKRRLEGPMQLVDVELGRYTGEHKERKGGSLAQVTITTLEALDSLLARRPHLLAGLVTLVLDEVHVVDNTPRGDQLRVLLERLEQAAPDHQRIAVSATVDEPEEVASRYLRDGELVVVPGARRILGRFFEGTGAEAMGKHLDQLGEHGFRKILVFCRTRNQVELYSTRLPGQTRFDDRLFAHHGSLARQHRERTERLFQTAPAAVCFATLTLEMGIDIGTVDYVLLAGPPPDVASLLQRIGRGGRRGDTNRAGFAVKNPAQRHIVATMARLGKEGKLCAAPYAFRLSVLVQQALVIACSSGSVSAEELAGCLPSDVKALVGSDGCRDLLEALEIEGHLERSGGQLVPGEEIEARYGRGQLHSNIEADSGLEVVDRLTGDVIGKITGVRSGNIRIGGGERAVVGRSGTRVLTDRGRDATPAYFRPAGGAAVSLDHGRAVVEAMEAPGFRVPAGTLLQLPGPSGTLLVHGLGTVGGLLLAHLLVSAQGPLAPRALLGTSPYVMHLATPIEELPRPEPALVRAFEAESRDSLLPLTAPGPWHSSLPEELARKGSTVALGLPRLVRFLEEARLAILDHAPTELNELWSEL